MKMGEASSLSGWETGRFSDGGDGFAMQFAIDEFFVVFFNCYVPVIWIEHIKMRIDFIFFFYKRYVSFFRIWIRLSVDRGAAADDIFGIIIPVLLEERDEIVDDGDILSVVFRIDRHYRYISVFEFPGKIVIRCLTHDDVLEHRIPSEDLEFFSDVPGHNAFVSYAVVRIHCYRETDHKLVALLF